MMLVVSLETSANSVGAHSLESSLEPFLTLYFPDDTCHSRSNISAEVKSVSPNFLHRCKISKAHFGNGL